MRGKMVGRKREGKGNGKRDKKGGEGGAGPKYFGIQPPLYM